MHRLLILSLLFLLAARPQSNAQTINVGYTSPSVEAKKEKTINVFGYEEILPADTPVIEYYPGTTHPFWFRMYSSTNYDFLIQGEEKTATHYADTYTYNPQLRKYVGDIDLEMINTDKVEEVVFLMDPDLYGEIDHETGEYTASGSSVSFDVAATCESFSRRFKVTIPSNEDIPQEQFDKRIFAEGSLKRHMRDWAKAQIAGLDPVANPGILAQFSSIDDAATNYVRNANFWLNDVDLTCVSPWNSHGSSGHASKRGLPTGRFRCVTAITPRHALAANHFAPNIGTKVRFVDNNNVVYEREIIGYHKVMADLDVIGYPDFMTYERTKAYRDAGAESISIDLRLLRFDSPLPASIVPAKMFPPDVYTYLPRYMRILNELNYNQLCPNYPIIVFNAAREVRLGETSTNLGTWDQNKSLIYGPANISYFAPESPSWWGYMSYYLYDELNTEKWYPYQSVDGDSSTPALMVINGEAVYVSQHLYPNSGFPAFYGIDDITNRISNVWGDPENLDYVDLSGFAAYEPELTAPNYGE
jgi:hypothetical protein